MSKKILEMKNITKKFPGVIALNDVSLDLKEAEILALVGENGAGKSTLMKILSGFYPYLAYEGDIYIGGAKKEFADPRQSEKAGIAMIYQEISMHLDMTIAENLFLGRWRKNRAGIINWKEINKNARKILDSVKLDVDPEIVLRSLTTGQMQLVAIARALSGEPKILVLDEPTSALTRAESENLFKIMQQLKKRGIASILISHKLDEVFQNADRITLLRDGKIISTYRTEKVTPEVIVSGMVGREIATFYPKEKVKLGGCILKIEDFTVIHPFNSRENIVEDVSFELRRGEVLGIAGLMGSGRSELVNAIFGKCKKKAGRIFIEGKEVKVENPVGAIKNGIALVTEDRKRDGIVEVLSIMQNATLSSLKAVSKIMVINRKKEKEKSHFYFDKLNIKAQGLDTLLQTLSGGNQQKVVLSKWLMMEPKILIMDEPTKGIDVGVKHEIYKIMMALVKEGVSVIMISSELPELIAMSDRILVLSGRKSKGLFNVAECTQDQIMRLAAGAPA